MLSKRVAIALCAAGAAASIGLAWLARPRRAADAVVGPAHATDSATAEFSEPADSPRAKSAAGGTAPIAGAAPRRAEVAPPAPFDDGDDRGEPRGTVTGRVTDVEREPIAGATIRLSMHRGEVAVDLAEVATDGDGRYAVVCAELAALDDVQRDSAEVTALAFAPGFAADRESRFVVDERARVLDLDVSLARGVTITGLVVDDGGRTVQDAPVWSDVSRRSPDPSFRPVSDSRGRFHVGIPAMRVTRDGTVTDWIPSPVQVSAERRGLGRARIDVDVTSREDSLLDIGVVALERGATIEGCVLASDGTPLPAVRVAAVTVERERMGEDAALSITIGGELATFDSVAVFDVDGTAHIVFAGEIRVTTAAYGVADAFGHFAITGLEPGSYHVDVLDNEWALSRRATDSAAPVAIDTDGPPIRVDAPGAWLIVRAVEANGAPLPGQEVEVGWSSAVTNGSDASGRPRLSWTKHTLAAASAEAALAVPPLSEPRIVRARAGWAYDERQVEPIADGRTASVTLVLAPVRNSGRMRVRASAPDGGGLEAYKVRLLSPLSRREIASYASYDEDEDGWSPPLPAGRFEVDARAIAAARALAPVRLGAHEVAADRPLDLAARFALATADAIDGDD